VGMSAKEGKSSAPAAQEMLWAFESAQPPRSLTLFAWRLHSD
jgi:hypothetical protein